MTYQPGESFAIELDAADPLHAARSAEITSLWRLAAAQKGAEVALERLLSSRRPAGVLLFGIPAAKDAVGSEALSERSIVAQAVRAIKGASPDLLVMTDVCCCEYTDHGHCGVVNDQTGRTDVDNDATLELLARQSVIHAQAGADVVAPSGMMDGMVGAIRRALDAAGFAHLPILSYAAKYASAFYGPFREAAESAPQFGDRRGYQMDPAAGIGQANRRCRVGTSHVTV